MSTHLIIAFIELIGISFRKGSTLTFECHEGLEKRAISRRERSSTSLNLVMLDARHPREKALYHLPHQEKRILKGSTRPFLLLKSSLDDVNAAASLSNTITESKV